MATHHQPRWKTPGPAMPVHATTPDRCSRRPARPIPGSGHSTVLAGESAPDQSGGIAYRSVDPGGSRKQAKILKASKQFAEHVFAVHAVLKTELSCLDSAHNHRRGILEVICHEVIRDS